MKSRFADILKSVNEIALGRSANVINAIEGLHNSGVAVTTDKEGNQGIFTPASRKGALKSLEMFRKIAEKNGLTVSVIRPDWAKEEEEEEKSQDHQKKVMKTNPDFVGIINKERAESYARKIIREGHDPNTWGGWILDSDGKDKYLVTGTPVEFEFDEDGQPKPVGLHDKKVRYKYDTKTGKMTEIEQKNEVRLTANFDYKPLLAKYDVKAVESSVIQYYGAVLSVTDEIMDILQEYETEQSATISEFSKNALKLGAKYTNSSHLSDAENNVLKERQKIISERLELNIDDAKRQILLFKKQAEDLVEEVNQITHGEISITNLCLQSTT